MELEKLDMGVEKTIWLQHEQWVFQNYLDRVIIVFGQFEIYNQHLFCIHTCISLVLIFFYRFIDNKMTITISHLYTVNINIKLLFLPDC